MDHKTFIKKIGFKPKDGTQDIFSKKYASCSIQADFKNKKIDFGSKIKIESKSVQNFSPEENWVVLECVDRLLEKGYAPKNITLEKIWPSGHGTSGRLDICVYRDDGSEYLLIECKTYGKEFEKELARMKKDGGQLFTYFKFSNKPDVLVLYASELRENRIVYRNEIVKIEDDYRTGDIKDFYEKWNKLTKDNGVFDNWVKPYNFESKSLTINELKEIKPEDSSFIFNRFLEILRHNVVSDKPNAFNKIFTLFLCKIYDEKVNEGTDNELAFQWKEGIDDNISFQLRLTDLYKNGMYEFLEKRVTDFSEDEFEIKYKNLDQSVKNDLLLEFKKIRLEKNNEFAIKEVYDSRSFDENAKVVKQVVELLQGYKIRYAKKQQYLSDFFELLLTTGLKQESGQFFTPVPIAQFIIKSLPIDDLVKTKLEDGKRDELLPFVIDYAAGSGHFITESMHAIQRLLENSKIDKLKADVVKKIKTWENDPFDWALQYIYGIEKDYRLVKVGKVGCYLHGDGLANVIHSDGLANFKHSDYKGILHKTDKDFLQDNKQFDILVSNPPYSVSAFKNTSREYYKNEDFELYSKLTDNSSEIECLFIERAKQLLKDGGVAGIILPSSILSNGGIYAKSREIILQYFEVLGITEFGSNTFMATGTNTVVLFLRRRNNYDSINLKKSVDTFFATFQDVTLNGIEKPVHKYVEHVWEGMSFDDYITLLEQTPNEAIKNSEIYREYKNKIKFKTEKEFLDTVLSIENEKLYYFILVCPQKVVLIKSGEKNNEKQFLGYEFSNRRGSEGIHPIKRNKTIDECTQLFDAEIFDNPEKASTYVYKAFKGDFYSDISKELQKNVSRCDLIDMLTFDRVDFEKSISLSVKKKVKIESKWPLKSLGEICDLYQPKTITSQQIKSSGKYKVFGANGVIGFYDKFNHENSEVAITCRGATCGTINYTEPQSWITGNAMVAKPKDEEVSKLYLRYFLENTDLSSTITGTAQPQITRTTLFPFKIPLPPKDIQEKVVSEIDFLEIQRKKVNEDVINRREEIVNILNRISGEPIKLGDLTTKIGSGATPKGGKGVYQNTGINLIRSQNIYDHGFEEKGLVFINEDQAKKLNNVTVQKEDILFNITGASIARCCVIKEQYLPARVNQHVAIIRVSDKILSKYVQMILISPTYKKLLLEIGDGATSREAITKSQLENFKIPVPPISEQKKIVSKIEKVENEIATLEKELKTIPQQKENVLKKYL